MADDRLLAAFALLDRAETPDPGFEERLFASLVAGQQWGRPARIPLRERVLRRLGIWPLPTGHAALRLAYVAAIVGLLLALAIGTVLVASRLLTPPTPMELVRLSNEAWQRAPAVQFTISDGQGVTAVAGDGRGTWRSWSWDTPAGSYYLFDGSRWGFFDADRRTWTVAPFESGGGPFPLNNVFAWTDLEFPDLIAKKIPVTCDGAIALGSAAMAPGSAGQASPATVAGRTVDHIGCPGLNMEFWLDRETHLTLRTLARQGSKYWMGPEGSDTITEVTAFARVDPQPAMFSWAGPADARPVDAPLASSLLEVGVRPPAWSGTTLAGAAFDTASLKGPAAVLFVSPGAKNGAALDALAAASARHPSIQTVIVGLETAGTVAAWLAQHHVTADPVADPDYAFYQAWGMTTRPSLVLLGTDGRVAGLAAGLLTASDVESMLAALDAGSPIPTAAAAAPGPTPPLVHPTPGPGIVCGSMVTCLPNGTVAPAWEGTLSNGRPYGSSDIAGRPAVLWFTGFRCDGPCPDSFMANLRDVAAVVAAYRGRATFVIISDGESKPGDTSRMLAEAGLDVPVVLDLELTVRDALKQAVGGAIVLDAQGRIVAQPPSNTAWQEVRAALDQIVPSPAPTSPPTPSPVTSAAPSR